MNRNDLLSTAKGLFLRSFVQGIDEWLQRCGTELTERAAIESGDAQRVAADAGKALRNADMALKQHLSEGMVRLVERGFETAYDSFRPSFADAAHAPTLSLIDTGAVESEIRLDWLARRFRNAAETEIRDLNIRVAQLFGQDHIHERENPFRPYMFARCIVGAVDLLDQSGDVATVLCEALGTSTTSEVVGIYAQLNDFLAQHGVDADLRLTIKKQAEAVSGASAARGADAAAGPQLHDPATQAGAETLAPEQMLAAQTRLESLLRLVLSAQGQTLPDAMLGSAPASAGMLPAAAANLGLTLQQSLRSVFSADAAGVAGNALAQYHPAAQLQSTLDGLLTANAALGVPQGERALDNLLMQHHAQLSAGAAGDVRQRVIDIVGLLYEFILRDELVPLAIRQQLARLQFLALKIGLVEPDLFTRDTHPLRRLINRLASVAIASAGNDEAAEWLQREAGLAIEPLLADRGDNPPLVTVMLDRFEADLRHRYKRHAALAIAAVQAQSLAQARSARYQGIRAAIVAGMDGLRFTPYVVELLQETWPAVIELQGRQSPALAEQSLWLVPDLIWSIAPKTDAAERKQLLTLIPNLLPVLKDGLKALGWAQAQLDEMQRWLVEAHKLALHMPETQYTVPSLTMLRDRFAPHYQQLFNGALVVEPEAGTQARYLAAALQAAQADVDVMHVPDEMQIGDVIAASGLAGLPLSERRNAVLARLQPGVALRWQDGAAARRGLLGWLAADQHHALLVWPDDSKPLLLGFDALMQLFAQGKLQFVEPQPLFDRAIASLLDVAGKYQLR
ncbi:Protein of unknown function [Andreprevotia lacus DSM 23236]|jgi:hypothetical protein|uniref:DUF1631 domain-containing protein n=1 Tax=Andreprevotia lacus DSM 23236 TaxID=1121001 RepID=A0A1W1X2A1_9NEIS|nr:DUF1631 family protein [Andreprevotia lacus]SMC18027.1 Protein of unknown function [Andreprevotia lacus DSM 23236]